MRNTPPGTTRSTTSCSRFQHDRHPYAVCLCHQGRFILGLALITRDTGHSGGKHGPFGFGLVPHNIDGRFGWSDEDQACSLTGVGELLIL